MGFRRDIMSEMVAPMALRQGSATAKRAIRSGAFAPTQAQEGSGSPPEQRSARRTDSTPLPGSCHETLVWTPPTPSITNCGTKRPQRDDNGQLTAARRTLTDPVDESDRFAFPRRRPEGSTP